MACQEGPATRFTLSSDASTQGELTPILEGGRVRGMLLGTEAGSVLAVDSDGGVQFRAELGHEVVAGPVMASGAVVAATRAGEVFGLEPASGRTRWHRTGIFLRALAFDGAHVLALDAKGALSALEPQGGATLWQQTGLTRGAAVKAWLLTLDDGLAVAATDEGLVAFDAATGRPRWRRSIPGVLGLLSRGKELLVTAQSSVERIDADSGRVMLAQDLGARLSSPPCQALGRLFVGTMGGHLIELDPEKLSPRAVRLLPAQMVGCPAGADDLLAVPTRGLEGELLFYRGDRARPLATKRLDSPLLTRPLWVDGQLFVLSHDGRVTALAPPSR
jgi:outer membrane protein assembly factor BamB